MVPCERIQHVGPNNVVTCCVGRNKSQHCCVLLRVCGQQCFVRLHGPKSLTGFKLRNKCQHCCGSVQTDATCWAQQCCVLLANDVVSVCMGLNGSRLKLDGLNHEQFFGLVTNYGLNFEAITDQDSRVLSPITDHGKTIYHPV